jgi:hypothetical protein
MNPIDQKNCVSLSEAHVDLNIQIGRLSGLVKKIIRGDYDCNCLNTLVVLFEKFQNCFADIFRSLITCSASIHYHFNNIDSADENNKKNIDVLKPMDLIIDVMNSNMAKLTSRRERNVVRGDGDNR